MPRFRKLPVVVEAIQFTGDNVREIARFTGYRPEEGVHDRHEMIIVETPEGDMHAKPGCWVIRGVEGEIYICRPEMFAKTYEKADDWEGATP